MTRFDFLLLKDFPNIKAIGNANRTRQTIVTLIIVIANWIGYQPLNFSSCLYFFALIEYAWLAHCLADHDLSHPTLLLTLVDVEI